MSIAIKSEHCGHERIACWEGVQIDNVGEGKLKCGSNAVHCIKFNTLASRTHAIQTMHGR